MNGLKTFIIDVHIGKIQRPYGSSPHTGLPQECEQDVFSGGVAVLRQVLQYLFGTLGVQQYIALFFLVTHLGYQDLIIEIRVDRFDGSTPLQEYPEGRCLGLHRNLA